MSTYPRIPPHANTANYRVSKNALSDVQLPSYEWDLPGTGPDVLLVAARREHSRVARQLEERKELNKKEKINLVKEWEDIHSLQCTLGKNFVQLNSFVIGNEQKRFRAVTKYQEDVKLVKQREEHIAELKQDIEFLRVGKAELDREMYLHKFYETFLNDVVEISSEYINSDEILNRYESLNKTKIDLAQHQNRCFLVLEQAKRNMTKMADDNNFLILGMSNAVSSLQQRFQTVSRRSMRWERVVHTIKNATLQRYREITEVKHGCRNLYLLMCRRKGEAPKIAENDLERQLLYIKRTMRQLAVAGAEALSKNQKTFSSVKGETSKVS